MNDDSIFRRRRLPHIDKEGAPYFVTGCLQGSISSAGFASLAKYRDQLEARRKPTQMNGEQWKDAKDKLFFRFVDRLLDGKSPVRHFRDKRLASVMETAFFHSAGERYDLLAYVVMPSHHHWLFWPREKYFHALAQESPKGSRRRTPREIISHSVQSYTATVCNRILGKTGPFWQQETFDRFVRNDEELFRIIAYIENNPVEAGLVEKPEDYRWSSAFARKELGIRAGRALVR